MLDNEILANSRITLSKLKIYKGLSEETIAFNATVSFDGRVIGTAKNEGHGGCTDFWRDHKPKNAAQLAADIAAAEAWVKTLKIPVAPEYQKLLGETSTPADIGDFVDDLVNEEFNRREQLRDLKRKLRSPLIIDGGTLYSIKGPWAPERAAAISKRYPNAQILNTLPIEEALKLYRNLP